MADNQFDISESQRKLLEDRAKRRAVLRAEFLKQATNPHIHATGEAGGVFDPAIQRFIAMKATSYSQFKPTPKAAGWGVGLVIVPILGYAWFLQHKRDQQEHLYRTGQVAYKDRRFKFC